MAGASEVRGQWTRSWKLGDRSSAHEAREALHSAMRPLALAAGTPSVMGIDEGGLTGEGQV